MKRILSLLCAVVLIVGLCGFAPAAADKKIDPAEFIGRYNEAATELEVALYPADQFVDAGGAYYTINENILQSGMIMAQPSFVMTAGYPSDTEILKREHAAIVMAFTGLDSSAALAALSQLEALHAEQGEESYVLLLDGYRYELSASKIASGSVMVSLKVGIET